jgi:GNAT superfamily N-acetyltransferase
MYRRESLKSAAFLDEVRSRYIVDPCRIAPIALWKVEQRCRAAETYRVAAGAHTTLYALRDRRLEFYWSDDRRFALSPAEIADLDFLVVHEDDYALIAEHLSGMAAMPSHPLIYGGAMSPSVPARSDLRVADFDFDRPDAFAAAACMLNRCYPGHRHTAAEVAGWCDQPAFDPLLWFWIQDRAPAELLALAISTYQPAIRETYLDWIQVLPAAQGRGIGRLLIAETLRRAMPKSGIIRVTGIADDFYRKCGFVGCERWWIVRRA